MGILPSKKGLDKKEVNDFLLGSIPTSNYPLDTMLFNQEQTEKTLDSGRQRMGHLPSIFQGKAGGFMPVPEIGCDPDTAESSFDLHKTIINVSFLKASHRQKNHQLFFLMGSHHSCSRDLGVI